MNRGAGSADHRSTGLARTSQMSLTLELYQRDVNVPIRHCVSYWSTVNLFYGCCLVWQS